MFISVFAHVWIAHKTELCTFDANIDADYQVTKQHYIVTQSTLNKIVSGRNNSTTVSTVKKLCDGLGIRRCI